MAATHAFLDHPGPLAFAHRGGAGVNPENTWAAFDHAVSLGYRYLETDVRVTSDGVVVAFHDPTLDRVTDRTGAIARRPWVEVRRARIAGKHEPVRLDDLLAAYPDVRVNIDPKTDSVVEPLASVIQRTRSIDRVCVASFSDLRQARIRRLLGPRLCVAGGPAVVARLRVAASRGRDDERAPARVVPCVQVPLRFRRVRVFDERFLAAAHRRGTGVHIWTVDDGAEMERLLDLGVDGLMTDQPELLRDVLVRRGQWFPV